MFESGCFGTARGGKSCADEMPGGTGAEVDDTSVDARADDDASNALRAASLSRPSLGVGPANVGKGGASARHVH